MNLREKLGFSGEPLFLIDGSAFIYRGFYANRNLRRSDGFPTNALLLVTRLMLKILRQENPQYMLFCLDGKGKNFRHEIYAEYKSNRPPMPEELAVQIPPILEMIKDLGIPLHISKDYEADDCMASLATRFSNTMPIVLVSGDKDLKQCLAPETVIWDPAAKDEKILTMMEFEAETGVAPAHWPDVQALIGDSADNIPGVPGIGPKTALDIFKICPSLEDIKKHFAKLPIKLQTKLKPYLDEMFLWRKLTTLKKDCCQNLAASDLAIKAPDIESGVKLAKEFEMASIARDLLQLQQKFPNESPLSPTSLTSNLPNITPPDETCSHLPIISDADALTDCHQKNVAIIRPQPDSKPVIALDSDEPDQVFIWHGKLGTLCQWLLNANKIITPDLKMLFHNSESFRKLGASIALDRFIDLGLAVYLLDPEGEDYSWSRMEALWRAESGNTTDPAPALAPGMGMALLQKLKSNGLFSLYEEIEMPLVPVLASMEKIGVTLNPEAFRKFLDEVSQKLSQLSQEIYMAAGCEFNIRSPQQLGEVLASRLGINSGKKTRTGQISTSQTTLEKLAGANPIIDTILEYRKLAKLQTTYLEPLPRLMDIHNRVHTTFNQKATATGRISSSNPNLQNIPVRGEEGKRMRACFVAPQDHFLVAADYSQIELRVLAHLSQDQTLIGAFKAGEDIHTHTAALIFQAPGEKITQDQRRMAKTINFGLLYGMGARKLAQELKISEKQASEFIRRYFAGLEQLKKFYDTILANAMENGFVSTMAGRIRWVEGIHSANGQISSQARRQAINAVIQGTAADIIKMAMIKVANDDELSGLNAKLILQIHDELLLEAHKEAAPQVAARVKFLMENIMPGGIRLSIPLIVDTGIGKNWAEAH